MTGALPPGPVQGRGPHRLPRPAPPRPAPHAPQDERVLLILNEPNQHVIRSGRNVEKMAINTGEAG